MAKGRVLITGGSGFIGSNVIEDYLARGWDILNLDIASPRNKEQNALWKECDVLDLEKYRRLTADFKPELFLHLAARTDLRGKTVADYPANVEGVANTIKVTNEVSSIDKALYASTRLVFEIHQKPKDTFDYSATTAYGKSKIEGEKLLLAQSQDALPWLCFRPTSIWGPWFDEPYRDFFLAIARNHYRHPVGRTIKKSFGFVGNSIHELHAFINASNEDFNRKIYFMGDYPPLDVMEWARLIRKRIGGTPVRQLPYGVLKTFALVGDTMKALGHKRPPLTSFRLDNLLVNMVYDFTDTEKLAGPLPFSVEQGVDQTVAWMQREKVI